MTDRTALASDAVVSAGRDDPEMVGAMATTCSNVLPSEFVVAARVKCARFVPRWVSKRRWVVLRGSKSPILSVYRQDPRRLADCAPVRMLLLGEDTKIRVEGSTRLVLVSSRMRKDDTLSLQLESAEQRRCVQDMLRQWVALAVLLQRLSKHESIVKSPNSTVYLCHDCDDPDKQFILKRVHRARSHVELGLTARIMTLHRENHELEQYLAQYFYLFEDVKAKSVTVVMKYYPGGSLADRIREHGPLDEAVACSVLLELCRALQLLHESQVLHLDVKASNIVFDDAPSGDFCNLKLVDFGNGVCVGNRNSLSTSSNDMAGAGTYGCMAPERFEGHCGPEADVYGAGIVLYHMLSGALPFPGSDSYQVLARNMRGDVNYEEKQWQHVSPKLKAVAARMLATSPSDRITLAELLNLPWLPQEPESIDDASSGTCSEIIESSAK
jgi:serine/threonine protein kinase